jgi:hypothetical protein
MRGGGKKWLRPPGKFYNLHCQPNITRVNKSTVNVKVGREHYRCSDLGAYVGVSVANGEFT